MLPAITNHSLRQSFIPPSPRRTHLPDNVTLMPLPSSCRDPSPSPPISAEPLSFPCRNPPSSFPCQSHVALAPRISINHPPASPAAVLHLHLPASLTHQQHLTSPSTTHQEQPNQSTRGRGNPEGKKNSGKRVGIYKVDFREVLSKCLLELCCGCKSNSPFD
ncbi:hypothetical protein MRB53_022841 [Persea americana]|uniref:Uncharacterized protein n=1 Tax=Persea americana TaxID=3435 RepID=A0ACC2L8Y5_PERAE|nr:hypothetical protein MRB53_022841 [Persea americana]